MSSRTIPPAVASARGRNAALTRSRKPDDPEFIAARQELAVENIAAYVDKVIAKAPPLSDAQVERLAALLRGGLAA